MGVESIRNGWWMNEEGVVDEFRKVLERKIGG